MKNTKKSKIKIINPVDEEFEKLRKKEEEIEEMEEEARFNSSSRGGNGG